MSTLFNGVKPQFFDSLGEFLSGGQVFFYSPGTTTKISIYSDRGLTTTQANPVILNSRGEPANPIWLNVPCKMVLTTATDTDPPTSPIYTVDQIVNTSQDIYDDNGNLVVKFTKTLGAINYLEITNNTTGLGPIVNAKGTDTNIPITLKGQGTGSVTVGASTTTNVTLNGGTVYLGSATATEARLVNDEAITDSSGNEFISFTKTSSAVNQVNITNAATGNGPTIGPVGGDTNVPLNLTTKGTAAINATSSVIKLVSDQPLVDSSANEYLKFVKTSSAINELTITNAATGVAPSLSATGDDASIGLNLISKGGGSVQINGVRADVCVQRVNSTVSGVITGTTVMVSDDTIPQNTEGDEYMTVSITPKKTTNVLVVTVHVGLISSSVTTTMLGALFRDSTADAISAGYIFNTNDANGRGHSYTMRAIVTAGSTSATTFKFRAGGVDAGTTTFNGSGGGRLLGGVMGSMITVEEYTS